MSTNERPTETAASYYLPADPTQPVVSPGTPLHSALEEIERLRAENAKLRDVLTWSEQ